MEDQSKKTLVSIIIPVYNCEKYINACLSSVINQTYKNLEIIVIDDGSTDGSEKNINSFIEKDKRIVYKKQKNQGQSKARNIGIKNASGDYICFIDADDEVKKNYIETFMKDLNNDMLLVISDIDEKYSNKTTESFYKINNSSLKNSKATVMRLLVRDGRMYPVINKFFRSDIIKKKAIFFDEKTNFSEDLFFVLEYLKNNSGNLIFRNTSTYIYNLNTENSTSNKVSREYANWKISIKKLRGWIGNNKNPKICFYYILLTIRWKLSYIKKYYQNSR